MNTSNKMICTNFKNVLSKNFFLLNNNSLTIIQPNHSNLNKNFDQFLLQFNQLKDFLRIIILSEIWISDNKENLFKI